MDDGLLEDFLAETGESLADLDVKLVELETNPNEPSLIADIFRVMHTIKGTAGFLSLDRLVALAHAAEDLLDQYRNGGEVTSDGVSVILAAIDSIKEILEGIPGAGGQEPEGDDDLLIDLINDMASDTKSQVEGNISAEEVTDAEPKKDNAEEGKKENAPEDKKPLTLPEKKKSAEVKPTPPSSAPQAVRISVTLLDQLMDLVGELVLARNQIQQISRSHPGAELTAPVQNLSSITSELQDSVMKTRMQPISAAFNSYTRVVRDLANTLEKKIELKLIGETTDVDRQVLDLIRDPLTHMVRNCADHALETPQERIDAGKPDTGQITLQAYHEGGHIIIKIIDDGRGISVEKVAQKALDKGLITPEQRAEMSGDRIRSLIFEKGFSTADTVNNISGRGVGMDAVRDNIEKIGGTISVESEEGVGTTFSIKIPLTLAIVSSFVVGVGGRPFAIPQINVLEILDCGHENESYKVDWVNESPLLRLRNKIYPLINLAEVLEIENGTNKTILLCQVGAEKFGIIVDKVLETEEIVVKPLSRALQDTTIYSGNTILGDGSVIMILDPAGLFATFDIPVSVSDEPAEGSDRKIGQDIIKMMVFGTGDAHPKAVHMSVVSRIDRIETSRVQKIDNDSYLVQYDDTLMPVICPGSSKLDETKEIQRIIVFKDGDKSMGFLVDDIYEIAETDVVIDIASDIDGVIGNAVISGRPTEILDVSHFIDKALDNWFKDKSLHAGKDLSVLIVDDSHFFRNMLHSMVSSRGYKTDVTANPIEALSMLQTRQYDVLVSDIEMPEMTGIELIKAIRATKGRNKDIPAIAISSHSRQEDKEIGLEAGFNEYLAKTDRESIFVFLAAALENKVGSNE